MSCPKIPMQPLRDERKWRRGCASATYLLSSRYRENIWLEIWLNYGRQIQNKTKNKKATFRKQVIGWFAHVQISFKMMDVLHPGPSINTTLSACPDLHLHRFPSFLNFTGDSKNKSHSQFSAPGWTSKSYLGMAAVTTHVNASWPWRNCHPRSWVSPLVAQDYCNFR